MNYQQPAQQYSIQEEMVTEYTQPNEINNSQQQIFYSPSPPKPQQQQQQIIQQTPSGQMVTQIEQRQMVIQQTRVTNHINQPIRPIVPQVMTALNFLVIYGYHPFEQKKINKIFQRNKHLFFRNFTIVIYNMPILV